MFGMLDYRAHKLLWLICWPIAIVNIALSYALVIAVALVVQNQFPTYHPLLRVLFAWLGAQVALTILLLLNALLLALVKKAFFWLIDVVPAHGADAEEARTVVIEGPIFALNRKYYSNIHEWTDSDTAAFVACTTWRARWFFPVKNRTRLIVHDLQKICWAENTQPGQLPKQTVDEVQKRAGKPSWFEIAVVNPFIFHNVIMLAIIAFIVLRTP
jgi:hypothetical protein